MNIAIGTVEIKVSIKKQFLAFRGEMSPASEILLPKADTHTQVLSLYSLQARHFSNQCDIYKVAKMGHRNWSHNQCNQSDTKRSMFTTTRAVLTELYTQVPSLSRTHTHPKYAICTLSMCCIFLFMRFLVLLLCFLTAFQTK